MNELFLLRDLGIITISATFFAVIFLYLNQPIVIAYLLTGILLGPYGFRLITESAEINSFAELGVALMLFAAGLETKLKMNSLLKKSIYFTFLSLTAIIFLGSLFFVLFANLNILQAVFISFTLSFSSTMLIIKFLEDKAELKTEHGKILLYSLIIQDVIVVAILSFLSASSLSIVRITLNLSMLILFGFAINYLIKTIQKRIMQSEEVLFLIAISVAFIFIFLSHSLGFSSAVGGFIAGLAVSNLFINRELNESMKSLRSFFSIIFFVSLGMKLNFNAIGSNNGLIFATLLTIFIIRPLAIIFSSRAIKIRNHVAIPLATNSIAVSEFAFVLVQFGLEKGIITSVQSSIMLLFAALSMILSPYIPALETTLLKRPLLKDIKKEIEEKKHPKIKNHIIVIGAHTAGQAVLETFGSKVIALDNDSERVKTLRSKGFNVIYGNARYLDLLDNLGIETAKVLVITIPNSKIKRKVINYSKEKNKNLFVIATAKDNYEAYKLYNYTKVDLVVIPDAFAGNEIVKRIFQLERNEKLHFLKDLVKDYLKKEIEGEKGPI